MGLPVVEQPLMVAASSDASEVGFSSGAGNLGEARDMQGASRQSDGRRRAPPGLDRDPRAGGYRHGDKAGRSVVRRQRLDGADAVKLVVQGRRWSPFGRPRPPDLHPCSSMLRTPPVKTNPDDRKHPPGPRPPSPRPNHQQHRHRDHLAGKTARGLSIRNLLICASVMPASRIWCENVLKTCP